jgi:hypothetical protein
MKSHGEQVVEGKEFPLAGDQVLWVVPFYPPEKGDQGVYLGLTLISGCHLFSATPT